MFATFFAPKLEARMAKCIVSLPKDSAALIWQKWKFAEKFVNIMDISVATISLEQTWEQTILFINFWKYPGLLCQWFVSVNIFSELLWEFNCAHYGIDSIVHAKCLDFITNVCIIKNKASNLGILYSLLNVLGNMGHCKKKPWILMSTFYWTDTG